MVAFGEGFALALLPVESPKPHEKTSERRVLSLAKSISRTGRFFGPPILVEKRSLAVLDGHHRLRALKLLGCASIPAILADYSEIPVYFFSDKLTPFPKHLVLSAALKGRSFPPKTTRHIYPKPPVLKIPLSSLLSFGKKGGGTTNQNRRMSKKNEEKRNKKRGN